MRQRRFDVLFLDLDDTLYDYSTCHAAGLASLLDLTVERFGIPRSEAEQSYEQGRRNTKSRLHGAAASHHRLLYAQSMCELAGRPVVPNALDLEEAYWAAYLKSMQLRPGVTEFLRWAREAGYRLGLITDLVASIQFRKLRTLQLDTVLDTITTSEEAGVEKPDPGIFSLALAKTRGIPERSLMIGDNLTKDVRGALESGLSAVHFVPDHRPGENGDAVVEDSGFLTHGDFRTLATVLTDWEAGSSAHDA